MTEIKNSSCCYCAVVDSQGNGHWCCNIIVSQPNERSCLNRVDDQHNIQWCCGCYEKQINGSSYCCKLYSEDRVRGSACCGSYLIDKYHICDYITHPESHYECVICGSYDKILGYDGLISCCYCNNVPWCSEMSCLCGLCSCTSDLNEHEDKTSILWGLIGYRNSYYEYSGMCQVVLECLLFWGCINLNCQNNSGNCFYLCNFDNDYCSWLCGLYKYNDHENYKEICCGVCKEQNNVVSYCGNQIPHVSQIQPAITTQPEDIDCSICLEKKSIETKTLSCNHTFHKECIDKWTPIESTCPLCRRNTSISKI